jgi:thiol-disulfide isomerase/thioredoxin
VDLGRIDHVSAGAWVVVAVIALAGAFGLWRARTDGRFRGEPAASAPSSPGAWSGDSTPLASEAAPDVPAASATPAADVVGPDELGERATLLQFSSAFCAPCRATRRVLADVADVVPGVAHVEVDAEAHLDAVRRLEVHRTPTTIVLDAEGREVSRAVGAPRKEQVLAALAAVVS